MRECVRVYVPHMASVLDVHSVRGWEQRKTVEREDGE